MRILIVEDEVDLAHYISRALLEASHAVVAHDGETALILDVMLPGIDGFEVLRRLRAAKVDSRVLILTARGEMIDRVSGLALGADDYLAKPFAMRELLARVMALGRRFPQKSPVKFQVADLVLNAIDGKLHRANRRIELLARERTSCGCRCASRVALLAAQSYASACGSANMSTPRNSSSVSSVVCARKSTRRRLSTR